MNNEEQYFTRLTEQVDHLLETKQDRKLTSILVKLEPHVIAALLDQLPRGQVKTFGLLPPEIQADVALLLEERSMEFIFPRLSTYTVARFLHFNEDDDAVDTLQILETERQQAVLEKIKGSKQSRLEKLLKYDPETAGGLMDLNFISIPDDNTPVEAAKAIQTYAAEHKQSPLVVVSDNTHKLTGFIPYRLLLTRRQQDSLARLTRPLPTVTTNIDREEVLQMALRERAEYVGVVNKNQEIVGIIQIRDLMPVVQDEATEDIYKFAGVSLEDDIHNSAAETIQRRYKWLILNVATATLGTLVVTHFHDTISRMAILAAYMPMVAGLGGNAATQALAVSVRGMAEGTITREEGKRILAKEAVAGLVNGLLVGAAAAVLSFVLTRQLALAFVLGTAMIINILMSGLIGSLIPLILKRLGIDPAVASSIFVTAAIDVFGFFVFLGIATAVLL